MGCDSCSPEHSRTCRIPYFLLILALDLADLCSDWLLYIDISLVEKGLVYGPPNDSVTHALLAFSIIGSLTFVFEAVNLWYEVFRRNPWLDAELVSMLVIWLEDLPQIAINFYIAWCREDPISVFQLFKASVVLFSLLIRFIISCVKYCNKKAVKETSQHTEDSIKHLIYRIFIFLGLLINAGCAIAVFIFTQTQRDKDGGIQFLVPKTLFEDKYNNQRYFQNVSIFIHHPDFDTPAAGSATHFRAQWIKVMSIGDIRGQEDIDISYNYVYENTPSQLKMALFVKKDKTGNGLHGTWRVSECYEMDLGSQRVTPVKDTTCQAPGYFSSGAKALFITFTFIPPNPVFRKLIFGDIRFNLRVYENQKCKKYNGGLTDSANPSIHYYRTNATLPPESTRHLLMDGVGGPPRFYRSDGVDLQDISQVWKTGWGRCEASGSLAPHLQESIPVDCSDSAVVMAAAAG